MEGYSRITDIEIYNFMSFKRAKICFDETGIINVKGYNDSGKSAILMAVAVCFMDIYKRNQVKFIRHGEDYFRVAVSFDDGITIVRDKYLNGQNLYEMYQNGDLIFTTKQGKKLSKIEGVPKPIEDYLGMCVTDLVYFNYQSCRDKLPLVDTKGSENYQMLHEVLRMEEIFRANQLINTDKNRVGNEVADLEVTLQRKEVLLERCKSVTPELIEAIESLEGKAKETKVQLDKLVEIGEEVAKCLEFVDIPAMKVVNTSKLEEIEECLNEVNSILNTKELPSIPKIDDAKMESLQKLLVLSTRLVEYKDLPDIPKVKGNERKLSMLKEMEETRKGLEDYKVLPEMQKVDVEAQSSKIEKLRNLNAGLEDMIKLVSMLESIEAQESELRISLDSLVTEGKAEGLEFVKCTNCGTYNVVGGETVNA